MAANHTCKFADTDMTHVSSAQQSISNETLCSAVAAKISVIINSF